MTIYIKNTGKVDTLNARETAPGAATENMYHGNADASGVGKFSHFFTGGSNFMSNDYMENLMK